MTPHRRIFKHVVLATACAALALLAAARASRAGIFGFSGEEVFLGEILTETIHSYNELRQIADTASDAVDAAEGLLDTYERVNAGIDELKSYSVKAFLGDFRGDLYHLYPSLSKIEHGTRRLADWDRTRTTSPFTAYEAISALAGDLTQPLRDDIKAGRRSIDKEIILQTEAAGGFALAEVSETSTETYDREIVNLRRQYETKSDPGTAAMVAAHANLLVAEQNSHIIRLLARSIRLDGVDKALRADERLSSIRDSYRRRDATAQLAADALTPPPLMRFDPGVW